MNDVEQIDRDAAAVAYAKLKFPERAELAPTGRYDHSKLVQSHAAHRKASIRAFLKGDIPDGVLEAAAKAMWDNDYPATPWKNPKVQYSVEDQEPFARAYREKANIALQAYRKSMRGMVDETL